MDGMKKKGAKLKQKSSDGVGFVKRSLSRLSPRAASQKAADVPGQDLPPPENMGKKARRLSSDGMDKAKELGKGIKRNLARLSPKPASVSEGSSGKGKAIRNGLGKLMSSFGRRKR